MSYRSLFEIDRSLIGDSPNWGKEKPVESCWSCGATKFQNRYHDKGCKWCMGAGGIPRSVFDNDKDRQALEWLKTECLRIAEERKAK